MTDGSAYGKMKHYCYRAGLSINRPAIIAYHLGTRGQEVRRAIFKDLEDRGMTTLYSDEAILAVVDAAVPDTLGKTEEEIEKMPRCVRSYKCGNLIEKGDPFCGDEKFNNTICPERRFKVSWHPGW
jgi:hypothetical protein